MPIISKILFLVPTNIPQLDKQPQYTSACSDQNRGIFDSSFSLVFYSKSTNRFCKVCYQSTSNPWSSCLQSHILILRLSPFPSKHKWMTFPFLHHGIFDATLKPFHTTQNEIQLLVMIYSPVQCGLVNFLPTNLPLAYLLPKPLVSSILNPQVGSHFRNFYSLSTEGLPLML